MLVVRVLVVSVCVWYVGVSGVELGQGKFQTDVKAGGLNCEQNKAQCDWILSRKEPTPPLGSQYKDG